MAVTNSLSRQTSKAPTNFASFAKSDLVKNSIAQTLGDVGKSQKFVASIISAVSTNPTLQECDYNTIVSSALLGEALSLSPSPQLGHYYLVPFNDTKKNRKVATFQLGYKGYLQLAIRSGQYRRINVVEIKQGELINYNPLEETIQVQMMQDEVERESAETVGYYAFFELTNGFKKSIYWSKGKMVSHAKKYSKGFAAGKGYTFWEKDFDGMAFKTMLRQLISKWGIMSIDLQNAFENDMTVRDDNTGEVRYFDNDASDPITVSESPIEIDDNTGEVIEGNGQTSFDNSLI